MCLRVQCASYVISLLCEIWFVWVNPRVIILLNQMWTALEWSLQLDWRSVSCYTLLYWDKASFQCNILTSHGCCGPVHHFAMSLPSVLSSPRPPLPPSLPPSSLALASLPCDCSATVTGTILSLSQAAHVLESTGERTCTWVSPICETKFMKERRKKWNCEPFDKKLASTAVT